MVDRTDNRLYVYPECDPPTVKDRSDIDYMRELAEEVNTDANNLDVRLQDFVERRDAARIAFAGAVTSSGAAGGFIFLAPYSSVTYDNTAGSTDLASFALKPRERGWYMFVSTIRCTNGGAQSMVLRHRRNGLTVSEGRRFEGPADVITGTESSMANSDVMLCQANDIVQTQVKVSGAGGTFTYEARLTMMQLLKLDV
jgi:hypothetical protein